MATDDKETGVEALFALVVMLLSIPLDGWVLSKLWAWFIVPLGIRSLTVGACIGVAFTVRFITARRTSAPSKHHLPDAFAIIGFALTALGIGALLHWIGFHP